MDQSKHNEIIDLIEKYKFKTESESSNDNFCCGICGHLMIDACKTICDCCYCFKCINDYLGDDRKYCPGNKAVCKEEYLTKEYGIFRDKRLNTIILTTKVCCPTESCKTLIILSEMPEHLRVCMRQSIRCPLVPIGCKYNEESNSKILAHVNKETEAHFQLFVEAIQSLTNDICEIKSTSAEQLKIHDDRMNELKEKDENLKKDFQEKESRIVNLERMVSTNYQKKNETKREISLQREQIESMSIGDVNKERKVIEWNRPCLNNKADFEWRFNNLSIIMNKKIGESIYSDPFYAKNYKLCLYLYVAINGDKLNVGCTIMKGDNDDIVQWPMKHSISLALINQDSFSEYKSETYEYDTCDKKHNHVFDRPRNDKNKFGIGNYDGFIRYSVIKENRSIVFHDSIVVSCKVNESRERMFYLN